MGSGSRCRLTALPGRLPSVTVTVPPGWAGNLNHFSWKISVRYCWVVESPEIGRASAQFKFVVATGRQYENSDVPSLPVTVTEIPCGSSTPTGRLPDSVFFVSKMVRPVSLVVTVNEPR